MAKESLIQTAINMFVSSEYLKGYKVKKISNSVIETGTRRILVVRAGPYPPERQPYDYAQFNISLERFESTKATHVVLVDLNVNKAWLFSTPFYKKYASNSTHFNIIPPNSPTVARNPGYWTWSAISECYIPIKTIGEEEMEDTKMKTVKVAEELLEKVIDNSPTRWGYDDTVNLYLAVMHLENAISCMKKLEIGDDGLVLSMLELTQKTIKHKTDNK